MVPANNIQHSLTLQFSRYEGGLFHSCMMEYIKASGDTTHANTIVNALTKESSGSVGNFLGTNRAISALAGKWNDGMYLFFLYL